jgi:hypothetical protein
MGIADALGDWRQGRRALAAAGGWLVAAIGMVPTINQFEQAALNAGHTRRSYVAVPMADWAIA